MIFDHHPWISRNSICLPLRCFSEVLTYPWVPRGPWCGRQTSYHLPRQAGAKHRYVTLSFIRYQLQTPTTEKWD